ncbi:hypothetical protein B0T18DRAFT_116713 [Schizothecium vesticola]|uniref:Uncharacterized protein n=1 Tax=Schizothecium vesticola TaxID=314040 RepID=A0AA40F272_9PEZI|nr:hypothetical protein B0T18DRAFT_116713 [Schizothecium vesticola]
MVMPPPQPLPLPFRAIPPVASTSSTLHHRTIPTAPSASSFPSAHRPLGPAPRAAHPQRPHNLSVGMSPHCPDRGRVSTGRVGKSKAERSGGRTPSEDRERAFIAASRRSDRSAEARLESAHKASEVHFRRTGRRLKITPQIVENGEQYESDEDDVSKRMKLNRARGSGLTMGIPTAMGHTLTSDEEFRRREEEINAQFAESFPLFRRQSAPAPYAPTFGMAVPSQGGRVYPSPLQVLAAAPPQHAERNARGPEEAMPQPALSSAHASPSNTPYMAFGSPLPQARQPFRSQSVDTTTTSERTPDWLLDSSATPESRGSPFEFLSARADALTDQAMGPIFGMGGVLRDQSPFDQGGANSLHSQPLFPSVSCAPGFTKEQQQPDYTMDDQGPYIQSTQYPFSDQCSFPGDAFAQGTQEQQNDLAELILLEQAAAFDQATQLNQLAAQSANMSSPRIADFDLLAEFTNDEGVLAN